MAKATEKKSDAKSAEVTAADVRTWAKAKGLMPAEQVRGRISQEITDAYNKAHRTKQFAGSPAKAEKADA